MSDSIEQGTPIGLMERLAGGAAATLSDGPGNQRWALGAVLATMIFWLDSFTALGGALAVLYVLVLLVVSDRAPRASLLGWAAGCALLTLLGFAIVHGRTADLDEILRMTVSLSANGVTTALLLHRRTMDERISRGEQRYEAIFNTLAVAIWEHDFRPVVAAIAAVRASGVTDLRQYIAANPSFVVETRRMVRITDVNQTALDLMGVPTKEAFFSHLSGFLPETDESFAECLIAIDERRPTFQAETQVRTMQGEVVDVIVAFGLACSGPLDRVPGSILNITRRKRLEATVARTRAQLDRAQRSGSLGAMSASIAHEVNQPLSAIKSYTDAASRWLLRNPPAIDEARLALTGLGDAVDHAHAVVRRVRSLVGQSSADMIPLNLDDLVADTIAVVRREAVEHDTRIVLDCTRGDVVVEGDRILLQQVFLNLLANALQAMDGTVRADRMIVIGIRDNGDRAIVTVRDNGPGWGTTPSDLAFETFFTTKRDGMGLGLSICRSIVQLHGGDITLGDHPEGGAVVTLVMPIAADAGAPNSRPAPAPRPPRAHHIEAVSPAER